MQTAGGASVSFQADERLVDSFDDWVEDSTYDSRSEALRQLMAEASESTPDTGTPLAPPSEERLATAYERLCDYANRNGWVRDEAAKSGLASVLNLGKSEVQHAVLKKLSRRGYVRRQNNVYGDASWKIVGWDDD
jgi:Arc/MetJ-type ribon-helix-helix transcriptional regulator